MANIKSAKKRIKVIATKTAHNKSIKSRVKTMIKKVDIAVQSGNKADATVALQDAIKAISSATSKGIFHKNTSARKISQLTKSVNTMN